MGFTKIELQPKSTLSAKLMNDMQDTLIKNENNIDKLVPMSLYLTFVGNVNTDMVEAAFGKNNEDGIIGLGVALIMYSRYKCESLEFKALFDCNTLSDILNSTDALAEVFNSAEITSLIKSNEYAFTLLKTCYESYITYTLSLVGYTYMSLNESTKTISDLNALIDAINRTNNPSAMYDIFADMGIYEKVIENIGYAGLVESKPFLSMAYNCDDILSEMSDAEEVSNLHNAALSSTIAVTKTKQSAKEVWYGSPCFLIKVSGNSGGSGSNRVTQVKKTKSGDTISTGKDTTSFTYTGFQAMQYIEGYTNSTDYETVEVKYIPVG